MTYTLADAEEHGLKAATTGAGSQGKYTQEAGILAYYEVGGIYKLYNYYADSFSYFIYLTQVMNVVK